MNIFKTDNYKLIDSFQYHDFVFSGLEFQASELVLTLRGDGGVTEIRFEDVEYLQVAELIPKGIVMSCYSFKQKECPDHLQGVVSFDRLRQYVHNENVEIFYLDGTLGFELTLTYRKGTASFVNG